jgi:hypothetical protein
MFQRLLIPLDGSERAERALLVAARLARNSGGSITLLRVVTAPIDLASSAMEAPGFMQNVLDMDHEKAMEYLASAHCLTENRTCRCVHAVIFPPKSLFLFAGNPHHNSPLSPGNDQSVDKHS